MNIHPNLSAMLPQGLPPQRPLLPNEPVVRDWPREADLSAWHLAPALSDLECFLLWLRTGVLDPVLRRLRPVRMGKRYPLGQCLEITSAAKLALDRLRELSPPPGPAQRGLDTLRAFLAAGGTIRHVWGDLRGAYFQNAFLIGTYYVDVANDTVIAAKPKVEIKPLAEAQFGPVRDFAHYALVGRRYWDARLLPNHLLPELAPWLPGIIVIPGCGVQIDAPTRYMVALSRAGAFAPAEALLAAPPLPEDLFHFLARVLTGSPHALPASAAAGRQAALSACRDGRAAGRHEDNALAAAAVAAALSANRKLAAVTTG